MGLALAVAPLFAHVVDGARSLRRSAYAGSTAVILAAALAASYGPARRAMGIDPAVTLRGEWRR